MEYQDMGPDYSIPVIGTKPIAPLSRRSCFLLASISSMLGCINNITLKLPNNPKSLALPTMAAWFHEVTKGKSKSKSYKIDVGPFRGVYPIAQIVENDWITYKFICDRLPEETVTVEDYLKQFNYEETQGYYDVS